MKRTSIFLSFIAIAICFASCKIDRQDKLVGYWKQIPFTDPDSSRTFTYWTFYAGDILELYEINNTDTAYAQGDTLSKRTFTYTTQGKELNIFSEGRENDDDYIIGSGDIRGKYWMDEIKKGKRLKIVKRKHPNGSSDGVYSRIELVKQ